MMTVPLTVSHLITLSSGRKTQSQRSTPTESGTCGAAPLTEETRLRARDGVACFAEMLARTSMRKWILLKKGATMDGGQRKGSPVMIKNSVRTPHWVRQMLQLCFVVKMF